MDDAITWIIIAAFYAPLHYLLPLLVTGFRSDDSNRRARLIRTAIDCTLSMGIGFALVIWLAQDQLSLAMAILLVSMGLPYLRLLLKRQPQPAGD